MHRALLILLMWLIPLQAVWSAEHALHGHLEATTAHSHVHDHEQHDDDGPDLLTDEPVAHGDDGRHGSHGHAAFTFMVADPALGLTDTLAAQPPPDVMASFSSHIPLLPDPPPAVRI
jgi:hypothetical protein